MKEIKKGLETCMHTRVSGCGECPYNYTNTKTKHSECFRMAEHALTLINELESENETIKLNMQETEKASFNINQMNGNLVIENQQLKDRIAELEKEVETRKEEVLHLQEYGKALIRETELKQFAERLKEKGKSTYDFFQYPIKENRVISINDIDETLKEFINEKPTE